MGDGQVLHGLVSLIDEFASGSIKPHDESSSVPIVPV
jgi:hypothetical protein